MPVIQAIKISEMDVGNRVSVRRRLMDGRDGLGEVIGDLTEWNSETVTIETRTGPVTMPVDSIIAGRRVPPATPRRRPRPEAGA